MMAVASRPRHDAADLRRLAELGLTPLHWRRSLALPRPMARQSVLVVHDGGATSRLLDNLLRAMTLAGTAPQLSSRDTLESAGIAAHVIRLGRKADMTGSLSDHTSALTLPSLDELRGNAAAKRNAWLTLRTLFQL